MGDRFDRITCFIGFHSGDWEDKVDAPCVQIRTCQHCGTVSVREQHTFDYSGQTSPVEITKVCSDCGATVKETVNDGWRYPYP